MDKPVTTVARKGTVIIKTCLECGQPIPAGKQKTARFCVKACKTTFHNRRQKRGAVLLDFYMATRFDRKRAEALGFQTHMARLASTFYALDAETRGGRPSWIDPEEYLELNPHLHAKTLY